MLGELLGGQLGAREVGDATLGARKSRHALAFHRSPYGASHLVLGAHAGKTYSPWGTGRGAATMRRPMADEQRTSLAGPPVPAEAAGEGGQVSGQQLPERRPAEV